jgi:hypothetical protein
LGAVSAVCSLVFQKLNSREIRLFNI